MLLRDEVEALRSCDRPQRQAQQHMRAVVARWREGPIMRAIAQDLDALAEGAAIEDLAVLADCFTSGNAVASAVAGDLVACLIEAVAAEPLSHVALRHHTDGTLSTLLLARNASAVLTLVALDGARHNRLDQQQTVKLVPSVVHEHVLAGSAEAELLECQAHSPREISITSTAINLQPGTVTVRDCRRTALALGRVSKVLVVLRLQLTADDGLEVREYSRSDGQLVGQAASSSRISRLEMATALLGRMGRVDAAPFLAAMAQERGAMSLRWQSLRECLALDSMEGVAALDAIASDSEDPLSEPAAALRSNLLRQYPGLGEVLKCPR